jgi:hypothetical protein
VAGTQWPPCRMATLNQCPVHKLVPEYGPGSMKDTRRVAGTQNYRVAFFTAPFTLPACREHPVPRQEFVDARNGPEIDEAAEDVGETSLGVAAAPRWRWGAEPLLAMS